MKHIYFGLAASAALAIAAPSHAAVIDFGNLDTSGPFNGNGAAFNTYSEDGFTVSAAPGQYLQATDQNGSTPTTMPALLTGGFNTTQTASLNVTNGSLFYFSSIDIFRNAASSDVSTYSLSGFLNDVLQYTVPATSLSGGLNRYTTGDTTTIDRLVIKTNSFDQLYIDNIDVSAAIAAVPEPATWAMMIVGFGMTGAAMRRRRRQMVAFA